MKRQQYVIKFEDRDETVFNAVEAVRLGRGMTRKGFIVHALANSYPELTDILVPWLMRTRTNRRVTLDTAAKNEQ